MATIRGRSLEVVLPEGEDERILRCAQRLSETSLASPVLLGPIVKMHALAESLGVRLEGCEARADAAALSGEPLLVERERAPQLGADEWWAEDLEGCTVHDAGHQVGTVKRLLALPSCEVLEVARAAGGQDLLVPLVRDAVRGVDVQRRKIEIDLEFLGEDPVD